MRSILGVVRGLCITNGNMKYARVKTEKTRHNIPFRTSHSALRTSHAHNINNILMCEPNVSVGVSLGCRKKRVWNIEYGMA